MSSLTRLLDVQDIVRQLEGPALRNRDQFPSQQAALKVHYLAVRNLEGYRRQLVAGNLFHYTDEAGQKGILDSGRLNPSLKAVKPSDARLGDGQYLSDIPPGTMTSNQLSRAFLGVPWAGQRFTNWVRDRSG